MIELRNKEIVFKNEDGTFDAKIVLQYRVRIDQWLEYILKKEMNDSGQLEYNMTSLMKFNPPNDRNAYADSWSEWKDVPFVAWDKK